MLSATYLNSKIEVAFLTEQSLRQIQNRPSARTKKSSLLMITMTLVTRKITEHIYETIHVKILNNFIYQFLKNNFYKHKILGVRDGRWF